MRLGLRPGLRIKIKGLTKEFLFLLYFKEICAFRSLFV